MRCLGVFHSAARALVKHELAKKAKSPDRDFADLQLERTLPQDGWIRAVVKGADEHSPRWRHILVLAGLLLGFGNPDEENISRAMRATIGSGFIAAINLASADDADGDELGQQTIATVLNQCFHALSGYERSQLDYDKLLPILMHSAFRAPEGLASAYFLGAIDLDVFPDQHKRLSWPEQSPSHQRVKAMLQNPLIAALGSLARLIGHSVEHVRDPWLVTAALDDLEDFTKTLHLLWRQNKLSSVEASAGSLLLDADTRLTTTPALWKLLRGVMFASVLILRSATGRLLGNRAPGGASNAPQAASQALRTLRNIYFISTRAGPTTLTPHKFVHLTAIDILAAYPPLAQDFLRSIGPSQLGSIAHHPLDRNLDLFFLNTTEYFTPVLDAATTEDLAIAAAMPYLMSSVDAGLLPVFEAAHSVMLATFCAAQNADATSRHLPFYVGALFDVFARGVSAPQFRFAYRALLQVTTPPAPLAAWQPALAPVLLELLRERAERASTAPLPPHILAPASHDAASDGLAPEAPVPLSEQAVLALTLVDALTQLPLDLLGEWLPVAAEVVGRVRDAHMREECTRHFWHVLVDGGMDPERSRVCHAWWSSAGGREAVLYGGGGYAEPVAEMLGALPADTRL